MGGFGPLLLSVSMVERITIRLSPGDFLSALLAGSRQLYEVRLKNRERKDSTQTSQVFLISNTMIGYMAELAVAKYCDAYINQFMYYGTNAIDVPGRILDVKSVMEREGKTPLMMVDPRNADMNHPYVMVTFKETDIHTMDIRGWLFGRDLPQRLTPERGGERWAASPDQLLPMAALKDLWFNTDEFKQRRARYRHESGIEV